MAWRDRRVSSKLSDAQLDGVACLHCGTNDQPMRAIAMARGDEIQLVECIDTESCIVRSDRQCAGSARQQAVGEREVLKARVSSQPWVDAGSPGM
jgi:hypothetical protein